MLEVARQLTGQRHWDATLNEPSSLSPFDGEERGLLGIQALCSDTPARYLRRANRCDDQP